MDNISKHIASIRNSIIGVRNSNSSRSSDAEIYKPKHHLAPIEPKMSLSADQLDRMYSDVLLSTKKIETKRLIIRRLRMTDSMDIYNYSKDERVAQHVLWTAHKSIEQSAGYIRFLQAQYRIGSVASLGIEYKETGKIIGTIGFMKLDIESSSAEIGYSLKYDMWNKGIMSEALDAMLSFGFFSLGLNRIEAYCETDNPASARVLEKCGMSFEGIARNKFYNKNKFVDVRQYSILFSDYKEKDKHEI